MRTIKELREAYPLTQQELADRLSVAVSSISNWERGVVRPHPVHIRAMARLFRVPASEIVLPEKSVAA